jgi:hypothetical protein
LFLLLFVAYQVNLRQVSPDTIASRLVAISLLEHGALALDEFHLAPPNEPLPHFLTERDGHVYDAYPPVAPLVALPLYAIPVWLHVPSNPIVLGNVVSKVAASAMAAGSASFLWLALLQLGYSRRTSCLVCGAYGLGTSIWSTASQGLWTHSPAVLAFALALWLMTRGLNASALAVMAVAGLARPVMLLVLPVWVYAAVGIPGARDSAQRVRLWMQSAWRVSYPAAAVAVAGLGYNVWLSGSVFGTAEARNANWTAAFGASGMWDGHFAEGALGLLASPSRGLVIYSPILLLALGGAWRAFRVSLPSAHARLMRSAALSFVIAYLAYSKYLLWWAGHAYGPRYLTDVMPCACLVMALGCEVPQAAATAHRSGPTERRPAAGWLMLLGYSVAVQLVGAFCWPSAREGTIDLAYYRSLWDWRHPQIVSCIESGPRFDPIGARLLARVGVHVTARPEPRFE